MKFEVADTINEGGTCPLALSVLYEVMLFSAAAAHEREEETGKGERRSGDFPILFHHSPPSSNFPKGTKLSLENGKMEQEGRG